MKCSKFICFIVFHFSFLILAQELITDVPIDEQSYSVEDSLWEVNYYKNLIPTDSLLQKPYSTSNTVFPRKMNPDFRSKYATEEFDYTTIKPRESLIEKIKNGILRILEALFGKLDPNKASSTADTAFKLISIALIGVLLYFIIRFIVNKNGSFFFSKRNKKLTIQTGDLHENIHEINFPESILQFEKQKDYRSAIRFHFLYFLKKLTDKKIIDWNPEKTNKDYYREIKVQKTKESYQKLAYIFDNVWYGEFEIGETEYQNFKIQFETTQI